MFTYIVYVCNCMTYYNLLVILLLKYRTPLDLAHDHGHSQIAEFLLSKGSKVMRCKKVSNALIILAMYL